MIEKLIVVPAIGKLDYAPPCIDAWNDYAARHRADLFLMKTFPQKEKYGHVMFGAVEAARMFRGRVEQILVVDADTMPTSHSASIFDQQPEAEALAVADANWPTVGHVRRNGFTLFDSLQEMDIAPNGEFPPSATYFNAGVVLYRRAALEKLDFCGPLPIRHPWDQDWLNSRLRLDKVRIGELPAAWNCMKPLVTPREEVQIYHLYGPRKKHIHRFYYEMYR